MIMEKVMKAELCLVFVALVSTPEKILGQSASRELTLQQAVELALETSPTLDSLHAQTDAAEAELTGARTYPWNPVVELELGDRDSPLGESTDVRAVVAQGIEIRGQRGKRIESSEAALDAAQLRFARERRLLIAGVTLAFVNALESREVLAVQDIDASLAADLLALTEHRFRAGSISALEASFPRVSLGRAEGSREVSRAVYRVAQAYLAEAVGIHGDEVVAPLGELSLPRREAPPMVELLTAALDEREDLLAYRRLVQAAETRLELARSEAFSTLIVGGFYHKEEGDTILGGTLLFDLPLFDRNQGEIHAAQAQLDRARADAELGTLVVRREVVSAHANFVAAVASVRHLEEAVLGNLEENFRLLRRAFEAGKIGSGEIVIFRRELVEAQRQYVEAVGEAWRASIIMDLAAGRAPTQEKAQAD